MTLKLGLCFESAMASVTPATASHKFSTCWKRFGQLGTTLDELGVKCKRTSDYAGIGYKFSGIDLLPAPMIAIEICLSIEPIVYWLKG